MGDTMEKSIAVKEQVAPAPELDSKLKAELENQKQALRKKLNEIREQLGEKKSRKVKYSLPTKPRTGKYAEILTNRDNRVVFENKLLRENEQLFINYLVVQKKNLSLIDWKEKYYLTDEQMKKVK